MTLGDGVGGGALGSMVSTLDGRWDHMLLGVWKAWWRVERCLDRLCDRAARVSRPAGLDIGRVRSLDIAAFDLQVRRSLVGSELVSCNRKSRG